MVRRKGGQVRILQLLLVFGVLSMLSLPGPAYAADAARGAIIARVRCSPCHFLNRPEHKLGPDLDGIFDRAPSISGVPFKRWDAHALDVWMSGPRKVKLNTTMVLPPLTPGDRADVIAYFKQQKQRLMASGGSVASPGSP